jgi:hypothetical protein
MPFSFLDLSNTFFLITFVVHVVRGLSIKRGQLGIILPKILHHYFIIIDNIILAMTKIINYL